MSDKVAVVIKVIDYIEGNLTVKLDLDVIARAVNYSKYHLHRIFTETVGITIHEYRLRRRLTEAAKLLVFSTEPLVEIAHTAGYESQQAFTAVFREIYKITPNQFREREEFYPLQLKYDFTKTAGSQKDTKEKARQIRLALEEDIPSWVSLTRLAVDGFPNLHEEEHLKSVKDYMKQKGAFIMTEGEEAIGSMLLGYYSGSIDFMAIHPLYRNQGINRQLLDRAFAELLDKKEIKTTTFRAGDKADTGYRKALEALGFAEGQLLTEFGYPTQEMIIPKEKPKHG